MGRVENELDEGEIVGDVGKRTPGRDKFGHGGGWGHEEGMRC